MKTKTQKQIEWQALIVSTVVNFIMAAAGIVVFALTKLQSLFLDGVFSFIAFLSNIMAVIFAKFSKKKTKTYPTGMYFLEPLYGVVKSILMFALFINSLQVQESSPNLFKYEFTLKVNGSKVPSSLLLSLIIRE